LKGFYKSNRTVNIAKNEQPVSMFERFLKKKEKKKKSCMFEPQS